MPQRRCYATGQAKYLRHIAAMSRWSDSRLIHQPGRQRRRYATGYTNIFRPPSSATWRYAIVATHTHNTPRRDYASRHTPSDASQHADDADAAQRTPSAEVCAAAELPPIRHAAGHVTLIY